MVGTDEEKEQYLNLLNDFNQSWAKTAPVIGFIFAKQHFSKNNNENHVADFDAGSAWMSMTLQARMHGLYTHGMAGIKYDMIADTLDVPDDYKPIAGFALGYQGDSSQLPDDLQAQEEPPSDRKPLDEVWQRGTYE
jgi:nitroreductase